MSLKAQMFTLQAESELRIEVDFGKTIGIKLLDGKAEIFGTEIPLKVELKITAVNVGIYTWHGCDIEISGELHSYTADETPMMHYANVHAILEERRKLAEQNKTPGPRVIITGPTDTGKSTLAKILTGYVTRQGRRITTMDLDVANGSITIPGMVSAIQVDRPYSIEEGYSCPPLVYFYGHTSQLKNVDLYKRQVTSLTSKVNDLINSHAELLASGLIINTNGSVTGEGYSLLLDIISITDANIVLVMDNERLYNDLGNQLRGKNVQVVKLPKSGGVVSRTIEFRQSLESLNFKQYFYGVKNELLPRSRTLNWNEVALYQVGGLPQAPLSALPIGTENTQDPTRLVLINPSQDIAQSIIAVSFSTDPESLLGHNVAGFLHVTSVDVVKRKISFLSPNNHDFPSRYLLVSGIKWFDT